jgi:hypothetical protein
VNRDAALHSQRELLFPARQLAVARAADVVPEPQAREAF